MYEAKRCSMAKKKYRFEKSSKNNAVTWQASFYEEKNKILQIMSIPILSNNQLYFVFVWFVLFFIKINLNLEIDLSYVCSSPTISILTTS